MQLNVQARKTASWNLIDLNVTTSGSVITVEQGTFSAGGVEYILDDDYEHDFGLPTETVWTDGLLVEDLSDGSAALLVDVYGENEERYRCSDHGQYKLLHILFYGRIPGGLDSLDEVTLTVDKILMPDEEV